LQGKLKVDDRLPTEDELAKRFEVSRPTVREALKRLAAQNLIRTRRGPAGGSFVARPTGEEAQTALTNAAMLMVSMDAFDLSEIAEARRLLETTCLPAACERRQLEHLDAMKAELTTQADPSISYEDFCASDVRFHRALIDATGNGMLRFLMSAVIEGLQPVSNLLIYRYRARDAMLAHHQAIYDAVVAQNADAAKAALDEMMDYIATRYEEARTERADRSASN
jgi:DNA-binding FadR family transcriptional regulator